MRVEPLIDRERWARGLWPSPVLFARRRGRWYVVPARDSGESFYREFVVDEPPCWENTGPLPAEVVAYLGEL